MSEARSELHRAAREYAARGMAVFPCVSGGKAPATANGHHDATTDVAQVDTWWSEDPSRNIGWDPASVGCCIIDTDGRQGEDALADLQIEHGELPATLTVRTPRGGRHQVFAGDLPSTVQKLGPKIDTRGDHTGYGLLPPSVTADGSYTWLDDREPAELPAWPAAVMAARTRKPAKAAVDGLDGPENVARAIAYLRSVVPALEGQGGDAHTFAVFCTIRDLAVSEPKAVELALEHFNPRCDPPWDEDELETKAANAYRYAQNEPGAYGLNGSSEEAFGPAVSRLKLTAPADAPAGYPAPLTAGELASSSFPPVEYAIDKLVIRGVVNLFYGDGGAGKTMIALNMAAAVALGRSLWGLEVQQSPVLMVLAEDDYGPIKSRLEAICALFACELAHLPITLWCLPGHDLRLATVADDGSWEPGPFLEPLKVKLSEIGPCLLVLDTVSDIAALNENLRLPVNTLCKVILAGLCREHSATLLVNAHPSKAAMADGTGYAGSTAWNNAVRHRLTLTRDGPASPRRTLAVAKTNYGQGIELELFQAGMTFATRVEPDGADRKEALTQAAVRVALMAAEAGAPITWQRKVTGWQLDEIARDIGYRPNQADIKEALHAALPRKLLIYLKGTNKRAAGYYPPVEHVAEEMARAIRKSDGGADAQG